MAIDTIKSSAVLDGAIATADIADDAVTGAKINYPLTTFSSTGIDDNADATALTIDSGENVAIGVTSKNSANNGSLTIGHTGMTKVSTSANGSADELVLIGADASANVGMSIISNNANYCNIFFGDEDSNAQGLIQYNHAIDSLSLSSNGAEQLRLHSNGVLAASDGIALGVGVNNTAANVLDDYEEGTWTPVIGGGFTSVNINYVKASYTKVGEAVHIFLSMRFNGTNAGANFVITGLPFTSQTANNGYGNGTGSIGYSTLSTYLNNTIDTCYIGQNGTSIQFYTMAGAAVASNANASNDWLELSATYPAQ